MLNRCRRSLRRDSAVIWSPTAGDLGYGAARGAQDAVAASWMPAICQAASSGLTSTAMVAHAAESIDMQCLALLLSLPSRARFRYIRSLLVRPVSGRHRAVLRHQNHPRVLLTERRPRKRNIGSATATILAWRWADGCLARIFDLTGFVTKMAFMNGKSRSVECVNHGYMLVMLLAECRRQKKRT